MNQMTITQPLGDPPTFALLNTNAQHVQYTDGLGNTGVCTPNWVGDYWPPPAWPTLPTVVTTGYIHVTEAPRECSGDVHVFPCPHCDKCKCGGATKVSTKTERKRRR